MFCTGMWLRLAKLMLTEFLKYTKNSFSPLEGRIVLLVPLCVASFVAGQVHISTLGIYFDELSALK